MNRTQRWAGLLLATLLLAACNSGAAQPTTNESTAGQPAVTETAAPENIIPDATLEVPLAELPTLGTNAVTTDSGLTYEDKVVGDGQEVEAGDVVSVHYSGFLEDGTMFDSSRDRKEPFTFPLGEGRVIPGWDEGVAGMKVGGQRVLVVPADLAYGAEGAGGVIPPNATLVFDVELVERVVLEEEPTPVESYIEGEDGLEYAILSEGAGTVAQSGDAVTIHYTGWLDEGERFDSSHMRGEPIQLILGTHQVIDGWEQGIVGMKVGEKRQLRIPPALAYGAEGRGMIPPDATLIFDVELVEVVSLPKEPAKVDSYTKTDSGLEYAILEEGVGEPVGVGTQVSMQYTGWLEDGTMFDSSIGRPDPFVFVVGTGQVIPGWDEGIVGMKVGEKRQLRIPSDLGYGEGGSGSIPPDATLIFDVELVEATQP